MQRKDLEQGFYRIKETIQFPFPETDNPPVVAPLFDSIKYSFKNPHEVEKLFQSQREGFLYSRFPVRRSAATSPHAEGAGPKFQGRGGRHGPRISKASFDRIGD